MSKIVSLPVITIKRSSHPDQNAMPSHFDEDLAVIGARVDIPIGEVVRIEFRSIPVVADAKIVHRENGVCYMRLINTSLG